MKTLFIMSSERSGTNLLRKMLGAHSELAAPPPPHLWRHFTRWLPYYGPLSRADNFRRLAADLVSLTRVPRSHLRWKYDISVEEVVERAEARSLTHAIVALYSLYAEREGASGWVCKENNLFDHAFQIRDVLEEAYFIYLCRDGRDVACSIKKVPTHDQHIVPIAQEWRDEQLRALRVHQELAPRGRSTLVRYEDLLTDPARELRSICAGVGIPYEEGMLAYHESDNARRDAEKTEYWKNLSRPVMRGNKAKFTRELSSREIGLFEAAAGTELRLLGYPLTTDPSRHRIGRLRRRWYQVQNLLRVWRKRRTLMREDGRSERAAALRRLQRIRSDPGEAFAAAIDYESMAAGSTD